MQANSNTVESGAQGLGKSLLEISRLDHILALFVSGKGDLGGLMDSAVVLGKIRSC